MTPVRAALTSARGRRIGRHLGLEPQDALAILGQRHELQRVVGVAVGGLLARLQRGQRRVHLLARGGEADVARRHHHAAHAGLGFDRVDDDRVLAVDGLARSGNRRASDHLVGDHPGDEQDADAGRQTELRADAHAIQEGKKGM